MSRVTLARFGPRRMLRMPSRTVRLRLTLLYSGLFLLCGVALLAATYLIFRSTTGVDLIVPPGASHGPAVPGAGNGAPLTPDALRQVRQIYDAAVARNTHGLHVGLLDSGIAVVIMTIVSIALGWVVAGRVLRPLRTITATTRQISERNLSERLALSGPRDELKDLADTVDGLLARLETHVAEQQRFAANASHELRTPLALTQTLLDVARNEPRRSTAARCARSPPTSSVGGGLHRLSGSAGVEVDGHRYVLDADHIVWVGPTARRKILPGPEGVWLLALGGVPGRAYDLGSTL